MNRPHVLLWTDSTAAYLEAIKTAGLAGRVEVDTLPRKEKPSAEQMARTEALMAYTVPPGVLPAMPKLRWAQVRARLPGRSGNAIQASTPAIMHWAQRSCGITGSTPGGTV